MTIGLDLKQLFEEAMAEHQQKQPVTAIQIYIESIENGFIITYSRGGQGRKRYAGTVPEVGEQVTVALVETELRGVQQEPQT